MKMKIKKNVSVKIISVVIKLARSENSRAKNVLRTHIHTHTNY